MCSRLHNEVGRSVRRELVPVADLGSGRSGVDPREAAVRNTRVGSRIAVGRQRLAVRGEGCVAADLNSTATDLYSRLRYDKLLWNKGDGTFTQGACGGNP